MFEYLLTVDDAKDRIDAQVETVLKTPHSSDKTAVRLLHVGDSPPPFLDIAEAQLTSAGISTTSMVTSGDPATVILETAEVHDVDRICLTSRTRTPTGKAIFGSVTQSVIISTARPVLVCHTGEGKTTK